jgi:hypothetical protein
MIQIALAAAIGCWGVVGVRAQDEDVGPPGNAPISYGDLVTETITNDAFFDWWKVEAVAGDVMIIEMTGSEGLAPKIGMLDSNGDLIAQSEDGAVDGFTELLFEASIPGEYTIIATRAGIQDGASTGRYELLLGLETAGEAPITPYEQVEFRCADVEAITAASLRFRHSGQAQQVLVYGLDGFQPAVRVLLSGDADVESTCTRDGDGMGDSIRLPNSDETILVDVGVSVAKVDLLPGEVGDASALTITIGSVDGSAGRYLVAITGFSIEAPGDVNAMEVRLGPLAAQSSELLVYMVDAEMNGRLDPYVRFGDMPDDSGCDDAGRRGCEDVPVVEDVGVLLADGAALTGDRFDAGLRIAPGELQSFSLVLQSFDDNTYGDYGVILFGELPPRPTSESE